MSDTVRVCSACDTSSGFRAHNEHGTPFARNPDEYRETDWTCRACGAYLSEADIIVRPPAGPQNGGVYPAGAAILSRPDVTSWEDAREAAQIQQEGENA